MTKRATYISMGAVPLYVCFAKSKAEFQGEMKALKFSDPPEFISPGADATCHHFSPPGRTAIACICYDAKKHKGRDKGEIIGLLVHEAVHVLQFANKEMGETEPGMEYEAYFVQRLTQFLISQAKII